MTQYLNKSFSVPIGGEKFSAGWERIFGKPSPYSYDSAIAKLEEEDSREPLGLSRIQRRIREWADYNFPGKPSWQPLLGVSEEVGELCHAHLKNAQGIRGTAEEWRAAKEDAVGDILIYLMDYCNKEGLDVEECLMTAFNEISGRDWIRFPKNGKTE